MSKCWWCCCDIEGTKLEMPYRYNEKKDIFKTMGQFCSWECMKALALDKYGATTGSIICGNMIVMRKKLYGKVDRIKTAPDRFKLQYFGGDMTMDEFKKNIIIEKSEAQKLNAEPVKNMVVPVPKNDAKLLDIKNTKGNNEQLKLKRSKPLKRDVNNLENVLGLTITTK